MLGLRTAPRRRLPYGMFDNAAYGLEPKQTSVLERIYHKGNTFTWDGKEVLAALIAEHGKPTMPEESKRALGRVFAVIMWGELAAWRISAELADEIEPLEAKMAATSQAFDEARHFYVMHDYLLALDALPERLDWGAQALLEQVMNADHLAKKLLGMQLMVEPIALTLFHVIKELAPEPVLTALMPYYEKDEARHVALGLQYLPSMLHGMSSLERLELWAFQMKCLTYQVISSHGLQRDLLLLGADPQQLLRIGKGKQLRALEEVLATVGERERKALMGFLDRYVDLMATATRPVSGAEATLKARLVSLAHVLRHGAGLHAEGPVVPDIADAAVPLIRAFQEAEKEAARARPAARKKAKTKVGPEPVGDA